MPFGTLGLESKKRRDSWISVHNKGCWHTSSTLTNWSFPSNPWERLVSGHYSSKPSRQWAKPPYSTTSSGSEKAVEEESAQDLNNHLVGAFNALRMLEEYEKNAGFSGGSSPVSADCHMLAISQLDVVRGKKRWLEACMELTGTEMMGCVTLTRSANDATPTTFNPFDFDEPKPKPIPRGPPVLSITKHDEQWFPTSLLHQVRPQSSPEIAHRLLLRTPGPPSPPRSLSALAAAFTPTTPPKPRTGLRRPTLSTTSTPSMLSSTSTPSTTSTEHSSPPSPSFKNFTFPSLYPSKTGATRSSSSSRGTTPSPTPPSKRSSGGPPTHLPSFLTQGTGSASSRRVSRTRAIVDGLRSEGRAGGVGHSPCSSSSTTTSVGTTHDYFKGMGMVESPASTPESSPVAKVLPLSQEAGYETVSVPRMDSDGWIEKMEGGGGEKDKGRRRRDLFQALSRNRSNSSDRVPQQQQVVIMRPDEDGWIEGSPTEFYNSATDALVPPLPPSDHNPFRLQPAFTGDVFTTNPRQHPPPKPQHTRTRSIPNSTNTQQPLPTPQPLPHNSKHPLPSQQQQQLPSCSQPPLQLPLPLPGHLHIRTPPFQPLPYTAKAAAYVQMQIQLRAQLHQLQMMQMGPAAYGMANVGAAGGMGSVVPATTFMNSHNRVAPRFAGLSAPSGPNRPSILSQR